MSAQTIPQSERERPLPPPVERSGDFEKTIEVSDGFSEKDRDRVRSEILEEIAVAEQAAEQPKPAQIAAVVVAQPAAKSEALVKIEKILEQDLRGTYIGLDPKTQAKFRAEGEKTASRIEQLMAKSRVRTHKIFKMIFRWLKIIPGVNKFFIKQEAKIKTDKILNLATNKEE